MTTATEAFRELITKWTEYRAKWIRHHGTDAGFAEWFSTQVGI